MALIYTLKSTVRTFPRTLFRGIGQVMFQDSMWTGILFTIGIFWGAYEEGIGIVAWGLLLGAIVSTLTGYILQLPDTKGGQGLWGFNGCLVGCAFHGFVRDSTIYGKNGKCPHLHSPLCFAPGSSFWLHVCSTVCRQYTWELRNSL